MAPSLRQVGQENLRSRHGPRGLRHMEGRTSCMMLVRRAWRDARLFFMIKVVGGSEARTNAKTSRQSFA